MTSPVRIPADVDMADQVLGPLTARQLTILGATGLLLYLGFDATRLFLPLPVFLGVAAPVGVAVTVLALGRRDGVSLDRMLIAAIRQRTTPQHQVAAPEGVFPAPAWLTAPAATTQNAAGTDGRDSRGPHRVSPSPLRLPATSVRNSGTAVGIVDLGGDGLAVVAIASTINFALRTPSEQESLVAGFGRYLHSLTAPVQVVIRAERLDLTTQISELRDAAGGLPHPALENAALEHADYLTQLGAQTDLLRRQVLLILREPAAAAAAPTDGLGGPSTLSVLRSLTPRRRGRRRGEDEGGARARQAAESRLARRLGEAVELLAPAGIVLTPLDAGRATAVLGAACNPDTMLPPSAALAGAEDIITTGTTIDPDYRAEDSRAWAAEADQPRRADRRGTPAHDDPGGFLDDRDEGDDGWAYDEDTEDDTEANTVFDAHGRRR